jgi:hypothetical protein
MSSRPTTEDVANSLRLTGDEIGGFIASMEERPDGTWLIYLDPRIEEQACYERIRGKLKGFYTYEL